jgi:2-methylcitrate dehydratase PrpD
VILALAVTAGIRAADAARHGVGGDPNLLDGPWLRDAHGIDADATALAKPAGAPGSVYAHLSLKPFCSAKQAIAAIEAFSILVDEGGVPIDAITQVRVRVPPPYLRMISTRAEPGVRSSTIVSAAFQIGLAAYSRDRLYDIERRDVMQDGGANAFAQNVEIVADPSLLDLFPASWPAEVEVTAGGSVVRKRIAVATGDWQRPLDEAQLKDKARRVFAQLSDTRSGASLVELGLVGLQDKSACRRLADEIWDVCLG